MKFQKILCISLRQNSGRLFVEAAVVGVEHELSLYIICMYGTGIHYLSTFIRSRISTSRFSFSHLYFYARLKERAYMHSLLWLKVFLTVMISGKFL